MKQILFDSRWIGNHGIGRFSEELKTRCFSECKTIEGKTKNALQPYDFLNIDYSLLKNKSLVFFSPSYNVPYFFSNRCVFTIHDLMHLDFEKYNSLKLKLYYAFFIKRACKKGLIILTVSEFTKNRIVAWSGINENKVIVVGNGVGSNYISADNKKNNYILYVGNKNPHKNIIRMIKAYSKSKASKSLNFYLSGTASADIENLIKKEGLQEKIKFIGFTPEPEMPALYQNAHLTLQATLYEGFGLPVLESMACGTPVVTSNITAMPEVAGNAAMLVDPYSVNSIATGIDQMCFDNLLRENMIKKGLERAKLFSWEQVATKVNRALSNIMETT